MNIITENIDEMNNIKKKLGLLLNEDFNLKEEEAKISLLNIDSSYRNNKPKNILETNNIILPKDPITTKKGSSLLKINYPNHQLNEGDKVVINNVSSINQTLSNSFYLFNKLNYLIIKIDHGIPSDYTQYTEKLEAEINLISNLNSSTNISSRFYGNIPINMLLGIKTIKTLTDIKTKFTNDNINVLSSLYDNIKKVYTNITTEDEIYKNFIFLELEFTFTSQTVSLFKIDHVYNINFLQINGIHTNKINSDYPINHDRQQGFQEIVSIDDDNIYVSINSIAFSDTSEGGSKVSIFKILNTISGYPNAGEFTLNLRKNFTNVVRIELVSSEFPFTEFIIKEGINNKLYWQHLDDGDHVYSISIPSGNYSANNLIETISTEINNVDRITSTPQNRILNKFEISLNTFTSKLDFTAFSETLLPNSIISKKVFLENQEYYQLDIEHPNNFVKVDDFITISNSEAIGEIPKGSINTTHKIYKTNEADQIYSIILIPFNKTTSSGDRGGSSIKVKTVAKVRFLFNKNDTLGEVLGFKNVGASSSITSFSSVVSNFDNYIYNNQLDSVGNIDNRTNLVQLNGKNNYWLLYLNNFESVILNNGLNSSFAKILLTGQQGDVLYNSFVNNPVEFEKPIPTISDINVKVTDSKGNIVDFENTNFSFTIRIFELITKPKGTRIIPNNTSFIKELAQQMKKNEIYKEV